MPSWKSMLMKGRGTLNYCIIVTAIIFCCLLKELNASLFALICLGTWGGSRRNCYWLGQNKKGKIPGKRKISSPTKIKCCIHRYIFIENKDWLTIGKNLTNLYLTIYYIYIYSSHCHYAIMLSDFPYAMLYLFAIAIHACDVCLNSPPFWDTEPHIWVPLSMSFRVKSNDAVGLPMYAILVFSGKYIFLTHFYAITAWNMSDCKRILNLPGLPIYMHSFTTVLQNVYHTCVLNMPLHALC